ncbi:MAG: M48 family metalloprotease, partial [Phycisphaerae bacterium]|nr:M48 family metalloprotease [Phycisphaerae bacterium]
MSFPALPGICAALPWPAAVAGVFCYVGSVYAAARGIASLGRRRMMRGNGEAGRWPAALTAAVHVYLVAGLGVLLTAGWARLINETLRLEAVPLAGKAMAAGPFIAALLAYWWATYPLDRALRQRNSQAMVLSGESAPPVWTRRQFMGFNLRHNLLFLAVPIGLIVLVLDVMQLAKPVLGAGIAIPVGMVAIGGIFVSAPAIIVRIWRTGPLPDGPLRYRLEQLSMQAGFNCRNILIWNTGGMIVNAAVLGAVRPMRYVLLSDALLEHFDDDAVAAIFAHEAGHIVHRHIPYMVLFLLGLITLIVSVVELSVAWLNLSSPATDLLAILA